MTNKPKKHHKFTAILTSEVYDIPNNKQEVVLHNITHVKPMKRWNTGQHHEAIEVTNRVRELIPEDSNQVLIEFTAQILKEKLKDSNRSVKKLSHVRAIKVIK